MNELLYAYKASDITFANGRENISLDALIPRISAILRLDHECIERSPSKERSWRREKEREKERDRPSREVHRLAQGALNINLQILVKLNQKSKKSMETRITTFMKGTVKRRRSTLIG